MLPESPSVHRTRITPGMKTFEFSCNAQLVAGFERSEEKRRKQKTRRTNRMNRALPWIDLEPSYLQRLPDLLHIAGKRRNKTNNHSGRKINNERELQLLKTVKNIL